MSSTPRIFVPPDAIDGETVFLPAEAAHHLRNVLRLRPSEILIVHDGLGSAYHCVLLDGGSSKDATARVERVSETIAEPLRRLTVAQALPKTPDKIEQVLRHGTEIGAAAFVFWTGRRSVARLADDDKIEKRLARWRGIILGAAEQSGRGVLPEAAWEGDAASVARSFANYDAVFVLHESATDSLKSALSSVSDRTLRLLFIVGPEGGLTDDEVATFESQGARGVTLGPRILRTETAALVALAQTLYHYGE